MKGINAMDKSIAPKGIIIHGLGSMGAAEIDAASIGHSKISPWTPLTQVYLAVVELKLGQAPTSRPDKVERTSHDR